MKKNIFTFMTILLGSAIIFNACKKNKNTNNNYSIPGGYKMNASKVADNDVYTIELWSKQDSLYVGYNNIYIAIKNKNTNEYVQNAGISIRPYMPQMPDMGTMMPCNNPQNVENNLFACGADFTMKGYAGVAGLGPWELEVKAKLPDVADTIKAICSFNVSDTRQPTNGVSTNNNETFANTIKLGTLTYRVDLVVPRDFLIGVQSLQIRIFEKIGTGPTSYFKAIANNNFKISNLTPTMPDMGHGSPDNVDPILNPSTGAYIGTINFTMTGLWDITYSLTDGTNTATGTFTIIL